MGLFSRLFRHEEEIGHTPDIQFGRFSDSYKKEFKYDAWDRAMVQFEDGHYLDCFELFFEYLRDDIQENIKIERTADKLTFILYQGSKKIMGWADENKLRAEAKIVIADELHIGFMRRLMEDNFELKYSRYALDKDNVITLLFDTYTSDASPYKLYAALKELATQADKKDDILISEFSSLKAIHTGHIRKVSEKEKDIKFDFFISQIKETIHEITEGKLNVSHFPGGVSYLLLDLAYRLDYLLKPEGYVMDELEKIHRLFFGTSKFSAQRKNEEMIKVYKDLITRSRDDFGKEIYDVIATFGVTMPSGHERFKELVDNEISKADWYFEHNHLSYAEAISGYIAGYSLFNYSLPEPDKELLHLIYQIRYHEYFTQLGFKTNLVKDEKIQPSEVKRRVKGIINKNSKDYPHMQLNTKSLDYRNMATFTKSMVVQIGYMNLNRPKKT